MTASIVSATAGGVRVAVYVKPKSSRAKVLGVRNGALELAVTAPPVDGAANQAVRELVAETLGVPLRDVALVHGASSRTKLVEVVGVTLDDACARLGLT